MKNVVVIDTSSPCIALFVQWQGKTVLNKSCRLKFGASEIVAWIESVAHKRKLVLKKLDALVICAGPGSFTGLRVGFSVAKGLGMSLGVPVIVVPAFIAMAGQVVKKASKIAVITDARRNLIYAATYAVRDGELKQTKKEHLCVLADFVKAHPKHFYITYDDNIRQQARACNVHLNFYDKDVFPCAKELLACARPMYAARKFTPVEELVPLYLHPKTCQIRK